VDGIFGSNGPWFVAWKTSSDFSFVFFGETAPFVVDTIEVSFAVFDEGEDTFVIEISISGLWGGSSRTVAMSPFGGCIISS